MISGGIICLCLTDSLQSLGIVCAHCHLSYIYISVGGSYKAEALLADALAGRERNLAIAAIGVDLED